MSETNVSEKKRIISAPVPKAEDHTISAELWEALTAEINSVVARIDANEELTPDDVANVRNLKKQVDAYLTAFNKAMRDAQSEYKDLVAKQLDELEYTKIENYIQLQRKKQTDEQNAKLAAKQERLYEIVKTKLDETALLKTTAIANELLPAFVHRFPKVNSSAKANEVNNWGPYEAIVGSAINMLEAFFKDPIFKGATLLPATSATMQQLLAYVRDGDLGRLSVMRDIFAKDAEYLVLLQLKREITDKDVAIVKITGILAADMAVDEKIQNIARIIRIAETL